MFGVRDVARAKDCLKHVELIQKINKIVIVASSWSFILFTYSSRFVTFGQVECRQTHGKATSNRCISQLRDGSQN